MKKLLLIMLCLCLLLAGCGTKHPVGDEFENIEMRHTSSDFINSYLQDIRDLGDDIREVSVLDDGKGGEIFSYIISPNTEGAESSHMQITAKKDTNQIVQIGIFSESKHLKKLDGTTEKAVNLDFVTHVNLIAIGLIPNIKVEEFGEKLQLLNADAEVAQGTFGDIKCTMLDSDKHRSVSFELNK